MGTRLPHCSSQAVASRRAEARLPFPLQWTGIPAKARVEPRPLATLEHYWRVVDRKEASKRQTRPHARGPTIAVTSRYRSVQRRKKPRRRGDRSKQKGPVGGFGAPSEKVSDEALGGVECTLLQWIHLACASIAAGVVVNKATSSILFPVLLCGYKVKKWMLFKKSYPLLSSSADNWLD
ncbi:hypothetical protein E2562_017493 [Oryza meyeriana var. granulata]|uniref:Uncharacterized protein n=1 Tax=Oryza meyeriana var. granulata TaxID=110450 RepID=A0A6G1DXI8_9ORYZ|nr:hypothetical protein E2562_017493 [Oryza meyeriana var. granulata]